MTEDDDLSNQDWSAEDDAELRRANSRWRSGRLGPFRYFNYGWQFASWALYVNLSVFGLAVQLGPFHASVMWKEPF